MKFAIIAILFSGTVLIFAIAYPLGLNIPITNPFGGALGLSEVSQAVTLLIARLNALSTGVRLVVTIFPASLDSVFDAAPDLVPELNDFKSKLNDIGASLSKATTVLRTLRQHPGKDDESTLYNDLHNMGVNMNAGSSGVEKLTLSATNFGDNFRLATVNVDELRKIITKGSESLDAINKGIVGYTAALDQFSVNEGKKYAGLFRASVRTSGIAVTFSVFANVTSDLSKAIANKVPKMGSAADTVTALTVALNNVSKNLIAVGTAANNA